MNNLVALYTMSGNNIKRLITETGSTAGTPHWERIRQKVKRDRTGASCDALLPVPRTRAGQLHVGFRNAVIQ